MSLLSFTGVICLLWGIIYWNQMKIAQILYGKDAIFRINSKNSVCLTLDDAPYYDIKEFRNTLEILRNNSVQAVFFVISSMINKDNRHLLVQAIKDGHILANHGKTNTIHALKDYAGIEHELSTCQKFIDDLYAEAGVSPGMSKYYRPGSGHISNTIVQYCKENNYTIVLGTNYPSDPHILSGEIVRWYVMRHLSEFDIIILHVRSHTIRVLDKLLKDIKQHYDIVLI